MGAGLSLSFSTLFHLFLFPGRRRIFRCTLSLPSHSFLLALDHSIYLSLSLSLSLSWSSPSACRVVIVSRCVYFPFPSFPYSFLFPFSFSFLFHWP